MQDYKISASGILYILDFTGLCGHVGVNRTLKTNKLRRDSPGQQIGCPSPLAFLTLLCKDWVYSADTLSLGCKSRMPHREEGRVRRLFDPHQVPSRLPFKTSKNDTLHNF